MFSGAFQPIHWLLVILVAVVIFGPGKLGQLGANLGKSIREFKEALSEKDVTPTAAPPQPVQPAQAQNIQQASAQPAQPTVPPAAQPSQPTAQATVEQPRKDA